MSEFHKYFAGNEKMPRQNTIFHYNMIFVTQIFFISILQLEFLSYDKMESLELIQPDEKPQMSPMEHQISNNLAKPEPYIEISGHNISTNLLAVIDLQIDDEIWTIAWQKKLNLGKYWQIEVMNIDELDLEPNELNEIIQKSMLQILSTILMEECYQAAIHGAEIDCFNTDFVGDLRTFVIMPLTKTYMSNERACAYAEFYTDHIAIREGEPFEQTETEQLDQLKRQPSTEFIGFDVKLCH